VDEGRLPKRAPYLFWIFDYLMVRKGYSKSIEDMEIEEYDFINLLIMELNNKKKDDNIFGGGL